jgi:pheromone shutdown protein TraB
MEVHVGDKIILIGTAHISAESVAEVRQAIEKYQPDIVAVELCQRRCDVLTKKVDWEQTIYQVFAPRNFVINGQLDLMQIMQ